MTTGDFTNWAGAIADIGPVYPFVGTEMWLVAAGIIFWLAWHVRMGREEADKLKKDSRKSKK